MDPMGYQKSSKRCKEKLENINKYFWKAKDSIDVAGNVTELEIGQCFSNMDSEVAKMGSSNVNSYAIAFTSVEL
ncbi:hypothetical protein HS088_TW04G00309 [Tripterygium wilfordii]|uniref:Uncharacterized protein n=1 Tax=Tripterygium wilfordii TaxID=458696 RepID=A0A7J7DQH9_TRIWF|nr:hypothetical protein HS088_TW04G00309 [Tripterygium wilfordii]